MRVKVTQDHILRGKKKRPTECPLALAIGEACGIEVMVGLTTYCRRGSFAAYQTLPDVAYRFARDFDAGLPVQPLEFDLECPT